MTNTVTIGIATNNSLYQQGGDLWYRARNNSLAHKMAAESFEYRNRILLVFAALLTVLPIVFISLSLYYVTAVSNGSPSGASGSRPPTDLLPLGLNYTRLSLLSIGANGLALFLGILSKDLRFSERASQHRTLQANYAVIAQKARRLEDVGIALDEGKFLLRHLQETFETNKSSPVEPSNAMFDKAHEVMPKLEPIPFGLTINPPARKPAWWKR
ncbi:MAG: hypothetical protein JWL97_721 [Gemmatimonadales bacterium]|nr:hypothetical protein [Gemmatimonadales bacterium]